MSLTKLIIFDFFKGVKEKICKGIGMYMINRSCPYLKENKISDGVSTKMKELPKKYLEKYNGGKARNAI